MTTLDDELKNTLRVVEPPPGFAERVLRQVEASPRKTPPVTTPAWYRLAAAVLLVAIGGGTLEYRSIRQERLERAAGEAAKEQVMAGLQIAGSKLQRVRAIVNRTHDAPPNNANQ
jgi:hypothetical protein